MNNELGKIIKTKRDELQLSVRALAKYSGLSASYISRLENGIIENKPKVATLKKVANVLKISPEQLFDASGYNNIHESIDIKDIIENNDYITYNGVKLSDQDIKMIKWIFER